MAEEKGERNEPKSEQQMMKELVTDLFTFREHYFETHGAEDVGKKQSDVAQRMEETLKKLEDKESCFTNKAEFLLLKGRCLSVTPDFCPKVEECLSRAVKLDPSLIDAWNILGEEYWKKKDLTGAKNCFTGALQQSKNNVSLRNLSMVLRVLPAANGEEHRKQVLQSVDLARQAVELDVKDGTSWRILGNAYESVDKDATSFSELHFNRATLFQYEEMFSCALADFRRAAELDPSLDEPPERENQLLEYLKKVTELFQNKGKVKARQLRKMLSNLNTSALGPCSSPKFCCPSGRVGSLEPRTFSSLKMGHNAGLAALGKVVFSLASGGRMAFTFGMVDSEETCVVVMVYNAANSWGVLIGDSVVIPEPNVKRHSITHKDQSFDFKSIRVDSPLLLIVNGKKQNLQSQIPVSVSYKYNFS
ncbi:Tetratricopeptide repeat protein 5 [Oryzias melastigma]|uniref:Tetratricopeptide repeat protein 5 n=1 Tax=Oryzias melastigma TaxID=30732 RepID=A0A834C2H2_ORYME|nr:Tetratricopeptide repeat protein 5 [Oryzias melastigma]